MKEKTHYKYQGAVFILDPLSESVVKVTHRDQTGYFRVQPEVGSIEAVHKGRDRDRRP